MEHHHLICSSGSSGSALPRPRGHKRVSAHGFTLVEVMVAAAILAVFIGGVYGLFLQTNQYAARVRLQTAAKLVLERAVNTALTEGWRREMDVPSATVRPMVLQPTVGFVPYDLDNAVAVGLGLGQVSLYADPTSNQVISATLYRQVVEVANPGISATASGSVKSDQSTTASDGLLRITFKLVLDAPGTTKPTYFARTFRPSIMYTVRARDD